MGRRIRTEKDHVELIGKTGSREEGCFLVISAYVARKERI